MFRVLARIAFQIDAWLHHRLGRPYGVMLTAGLMLDIFHRIADTPRQVESHHNLLGVAAAVAMEFALLIHQFAEMHHRLGSKAKTDAAA